MAGDGVMEFSDWMIADALKKNSCVKVPEFPDELTCLKLDESDVSVEWRVYVPKGSECPECEERRGYYEDAETIRNQQKRIAELEATVARQSQAFDGIATRRGELDELAEMLDAAGIEYDEMPKRRWTLRSLHWQTEGGNAVAYEYPGGRLMLSSDGGMFASSGTIAALAVENRRRAER